MKSPASLSLLILFCCGTLLAQNYTVSGYIIDQESGETLIGANIIVQGQTRGAATDNNGYFWISSLAAGQYKLEISYIGYQTRIIEVDIQNKSQVLREIALKPVKLEAEETVVTARKSELIDTGIETSPIEIDRETILNIPAAKKDLFKSLKYMPGIEGIDPFSPLYAVRGSDPGENLVLLDGVTIYNPYHFVTSSGLFNVYALKKAEMLVGGFGAEYGGRNSSVLYITTREGNNKQLHGEIEPTTTLTSAIIDFPIGENATMIVSGRFYNNLITRFLLDMPSYFYDTNISINWKINTYNRLKLNYFQSQDYLNYSFARFAHYFKAMMNEQDKDIFDDYDVIYHTAWNNRAVSLSLKTVVSPAIYLQTQLCGSFFSADNRTRFQMNYTDEITQTKVKMDYRTDIQNKISDLGFISSLNIKPALTHSLQMGVIYNQYSFGNDVRINTLGEGMVTRRPELWATFIEDKIDLGNFTFRPGLRSSKFSFLDKWYQEPRFNMVVQLGQQFRLKAAWGKYDQFIISINSQEYELSQFLDYYYPLKHRDPSTSTHYIIGLEKSFSSGIQLSVDLYYKDISRVYTFDYNASELEIYHFVDKLKPGRGKSYGLEILLNGQWDKLSGSLSYGLSHSSRSYPHIMNGKTFLFDYDRTHSLKGIANYQANPALAFSATLVFQSGVPKSLESGMQSYFYYDPQSNEYAFFPTYINNVKNNGRMPYYLCLDLGLKKHIRRGFGAELANFLGARESYFNLTLGNILFFMHRNVIWYFPIDDKGKVMWYGFGINYLPELSVGYTIKF